MKIKLLIIILLASISAFSGQVKLCWEPSCDSAVTGYKIYYGWSSNSLPQIGVGSTYFPCRGTSYPNTFYSSDLVRCVDAGNTNTITLTNLLEGMYYFFTATSYDSSGMESDFSNQAIYRVPFAYTNGGPLPLVTMSIADYETNWFASPIISTNIKTGAVFTNYYSLKIKTFRFQDDLVIPTNWTVVQSTNLASTNWFYYASGTNSLVNVIITNYGDNRFFKLKF